MDFFVTIKPSTTTEVVKGEKKEKEKISKRIYRTSQKITIINVFICLLVFESLLLESSPALGITVHLTSLGCPPTLYLSLDVLWELLSF